MTDASPRAHPVLLGLYLVPLFGLGIAFLSGAGAPARGVFAAAFLAYAGAGVAFAGVARAFPRPVAPSAARPVDRFVAELAGDEEGVVEVEGVARADGASVLRAPLTGDPCLWFEVRLERLARGADGAWSWRTVASESAGAVFTLEDDSGRVRVERAAEEVRLAPFHRFESVNPAHAGVAAWRARISADPEVGGTEWRPGSEGRFVEDRVRPGDLVRLRGRVRRDAAGTVIVEAVEAAPPPPLAVEPGALDGGAFTVPPARDRRAFQGATLAVLGAGLLFWGAFELVQSLLSGEAAGALAAIGG